MALQTPDFELLRQRYLQEVSNQNPQAAVGSDSDHFVRASGVAAAVESLHQHVWWLSRQLFPDTAEVEYLERLASQYGVSRKPAAVATGTATISGTSGTTVSAGLQLQDAVGALYEVTADAVVGGGGTVDAAVWALQGGTAGNLDAGAPLTITASIPGLNAAAVVVSLAGGDDAEGDTALRERLLEVMRNAPAGGAAADYRRWALEVPGVDRAFVFGTRRGLGTVDVAVMTDEGLPTSGLITAVEDYIDERRPVATDVLILAPDLVTVDVAATVSLSGVLLPNAQAAAAAAIGAYMATLAPGDTVYRSRLLAAIQDVTGVVHVTLTAPAADVTSTVSSLVLELPQLGDVTLTV